MGESTVSNLCRFVDHAAYWRLKNWAAGGAIISLRYAILNTPKAFIILQAESPTYSQPDPSSDPGFIRSLLLPSTALNFA